MKLVLTISTINLRFEHKVSKFLSQFEHNWVLYCPHSKEKGQHPERKDLYVR